MQNITMNGFQLSPQQENLWLRQPQSTALRAQCAVLLAGKPDAASLQHALRQVVRRHEILRTTFHRRPGMKFPFQVVDDAQTPFAWREVDLSGHAEPEQQERSAEVFRQDGQEAFDLERGPLVRATLLILSADKRRLVLTLSAICADAWSLKNLVRELDLLCDPSAPGEMVDAEPLQYADFAQWHHELLEEEEAEEGREFWRKQSYPTAASLSLPFENRAEARAGGPAAPGLNINRRPLSLAPETASRIAEVAQRFNVGPRSVLLGCWQVLLWRLTGESEVATSVLFEGREYEELEGALGLYARSLPVGAHLQGQDSFAEVLRLVDEKVRRAAERQQYFCQTWLDAAAEKTEKAAAGTDLPFAFEYREWSVARGDASHALEVEDFYVCAGLFKVRLSLLQRGETLSGELQYDSDLFAQEEIARLAGQFDILLKAAIGDPEQAVGKLPLLAEAERRQLLYEFNDARSATRVERCVHEVFEEQAARTPHALALVYEGQRLTYARLNERANQLARYLRCLGVGPETRVALCLERSLETIVAMLGVLKAGGAYVPLDLSQPKERLALMLAETRPRVILTQPQLAGRLAPGDAVSVCLDADNHLITRESGRDLPSVTTARNLAYVLFTSGSTGTPKQVAVEHAQLANYIEGIGERAEFPAGASFAVVSTFAADLGNTVIFPALCSGGALHVIAQERLSDGGALAEYFSRHTIDCLKIVPGHLDALMTSAPEGRSVLPRRRLILGGEASRRDWAEALQRLAPDCVIFNHYGPTETTVGVLTERMSEHETVCQAATLPLGRPLGNSRVHLLDSRMQPVPVWTAGELYIGGAGLARGYLGQPGFTAERFVPDPFSEEPGARLYRTGDLARYWPDGRIEFLGRGDHQVKIRGFRIELGEIEVALQKHPGIREAAVTAPADEKGERRIVAYVVPAPGASVKLDELRRFLLERLPDYMTPATFVRLDALPLNANGKLDRKALPAPEEAAGQERVVVPPRNAVEQVVSDIWSEVIGVEQIGVHDDFFELGGHSLLAMQIISRLRETFHVELHPGMLFEATTLEKLAAAIAAHESAPGRAEKIAVIHLKVKSMSADAINEQLQARNTEGVLAQ